MHILLLQKKKKNFLFVVINVAVVMYDSTPVQCSFKSKWAGVRFESTLVGFAGSPADTECGEVGSGEDC
ncbi:unnamed protein product [Ixodes pacificus]